MDKFKKSILYAIIAGLIFILGWTIGWYKHVPEQPKPIHHYHTDYIYDTVYNVEYRDRWHIKNDTAYFNCIDTLIDSVYVEVPIYRYQYDTMGVKASISGFNVSLDSLEVETKVITDSVIVPYEERRFHWGWGFAIGFGYVR